MLKRLLIIVLLIPLFSWAQSTGKIAGYVTDASTGEGLAGANIVIEGTLMGAQSDADGLYFILNVPVGTHDVRAVYVGYGDVLVQQARVSANTTTNQDFSMQESAIEVDAVIVTAERPLVEKNVTQSYSLVTSENIETIPVRGFNSLIALQASVVVQDGNVHIRGGRTEETGYYLDGANVTSPLSNTNAVYIIQDAVEEIQVLTGGYTAEFGGANSGIIQSELKTGGRDYNLSLDFQTDNFVAKGEKFLGTYSSQDHFLTATAAGPIVSENIRFFVAYENYFVGDTKKRFSKGYEFNDLMDFNTSNNQDTTYNISYPDGFTPGNERTRHSINSTLLFDSNPFQFRVSALYNYREEYFTNQPMLEVLNSRDQMTVANTLLLSGKFTHVVSPTTFYDLKVSYFDAGTETEDDWYGTNWRAWNDSARIADDYGVTMRSAFRDFNTSAYRYDLSGFPFSRNGDVESSYFKSDNQYFSVNGTITNQMNVHELKAGFEYRQHTLRRFLINPEVMSTIDPGQTEDQVNPVVWKEFLGNTYGYDFYGNELDSGEDGAREPVFASAYLHDKIEYSDLIINAGIRLDYFDTKDRTLISPDNPDVNVTTSTIAESAWKDLDPVMKVSPRLGFSFPASERTVFYAQYGKFSQMPELNDVYYNSSQYGTQIVSGGNFYTAPVGFGLKPMHTTAYEVGFRQQVGENVAFDLTGFYKNIKGQPGASRIIANPLSEITTFNYITNGDFATTKGLEFKLQVRRTKNLSAQLNYTLTSAEGTGSGETAYLSAVDRNAETPTIVSPLDYSQTHRGSINLDYRFGRDEGGPVLNQLGANVLFSFNSGHPYTSVYYPPGGQVNAYDAGVDYMLDTRSREAREPINASETPWVFNTDLRLDKSFTVTDDLTATIYMRVTNLFNSKNPVNVYEATGSSSDDGHLADPNYSGDFVNVYGEQYIEMYKAINGKNGQSYLDFVGEELYDNPRQILFGIKVVY